MEEAKNFKNFKVISCRDYEKVSNAVWKCLQWTNMVDKELESQGVFDVLYTPPQALTNLA
jgi:hypothetical protein